MRIKDDLKQEAIIKATVKLVNEIGFVSASVSKIAKEADVSPATIYVYYKNKEDLLVSTYVDIKKSMGSVLLENFDESLPIRDILRHVWIKGYDFISKNREFFQYTEQFSNSPFAELVNGQEVNAAFEPLFRVIQRGIYQKIIKNVPMDMLVAFMLYPLMTLSNPRLCKEMKFDSTAIEQAFTLAWDAIKL